MKIVEMLAAMVVLSLFLVGCNNNGGGKSAAESCEDLCDFLVECDLIPEEAGCEDGCETLETVEDEIPGECDDAWSDYVDCLTDQECDEVDEDDCEDEIEALADACEEFAL